MVHAIRRNFQRMVPVFHQSELSQSHAAASPNFCRLTNIICRHASGPADHNRQSKTQTPSHSPSVKAAASGIEGFSKARHHFNDECENALNDHITLELQAYYEYTALAFTFYHDSVGLVNFAKYFKRQAEEELNHAHTMMEYLVKRGGVLRLQGLPPPAESVRTALAAFERAIDSEKRVNDSLLALHATADRAKDYNFVDFIEMPFLEEQVQSLKAMSDLHSQLSRLGTGQGEVLFDRLILAKEYGNQPLVLDMQAGSTGAAMKNSGNANTETPML